MYVCVYMCIKRMAILAVGDFDAYAGGVEKVKQQIESIFNVEALREFQPTHAPAMITEKGPKVSIFTDTEATTSGVYVDCMRPRQPVVDHKDYQV